MINRENIGKRITASVPMGWDKDDNPNPNQTVSGIIKDISPTEQGYWVEFDSESTKILNGFSTGVIYIEMITTIA